MPLGRTKNLLALSSFMAPYILQIFPSWVADTLMSTDGTACLVQTSLAACLFYVYDLLGGESQNWDNSKNSEEV